MKRNDGKAAETAGTKQGHGMSRRAFSRLAMLGLAGGTLMPGELLLEARPKGLRLPNAHQQEASGLSPQAQAEVNEKLSRIFAEFGGRLSEEQKRRMREIVSYHVRMLETVRAIPLENPDAPATALKLVHGRGAARTASRTKTARSARRQR